MAARCGITLTNRPPQILVWIPQGQLGKNENTASPQIRLRMQRITGALLYLAVQTLPDIAKAVNICSEHAADPSKIHLQAANQVLGYVLVTKHYGLHYGRQTDHPILEAGDAAYGDDAETRRSSHGYVLFLYGTPVFWTSKKQDTVTHSTVEAMR
jgi:hypothetical protein